MGMSSGTLPTGGRPAFLTVVYATGQAPSPHFSPWPGNNAKVLPGGNSVGEGDEHAFVAATRADAQDYLS